jgi:hypothetical protein
MKLCPARRPDVAHRAERVWREAVEAPLASMHG